MHDDASYLHLLRRALGGAMSHVDCNGLEPALSGSADKKYLSVDHEAGSSSGVSMAACVTSRAPSPQAPGGGA